MHTRKLCVCAAIAAASFTVSAETVYLTANSTSGFTTATEWSNKKVPSSDNDYIVANGYYLRGDYSQEFAGNSLQFGVVGGTKGIFFKEHEGTHTFKKLILANGFYRTWIGTGTGLSANIAGNCVVTSPEDAPFEIYSTHDAGTSEYTTYWDATLSGATGTGLRVGPHWKATKSLPTVHFTADNSDYLGSFALFGTNATVVINSGTALGGALASMKHDAVSLEDNTTLRASGAFTLPKTLNRGIWVKANGGRVNVPSGSAMTVEWPISGTGTLTKTGDGALTLDGALNDATATSARVKVVAGEGALVIGGGFSQPSAGEISVAEGATISVEPGCEKTVGGISFDGGSLKVVYDEALKTNGVLALSDATALAASPIPVQPPTNRVVTMPFMKVPTSVGTISAATFKLPDNHAAMQLPSATFSVKTVGDVQIAYMKTLPLVYLVETNSNDRGYLRYGSETWRWSDNQIPHADADYEVGVHVRELIIFSTGLGAEETLKPTTLTFRGLFNSISSYKRAYLGNSSTPFTIDRLTGDIRAYSSVRFFLKPKSESEIRLCGKLHVSNNLYSDLGFSLRTSGNTTVCIDSDISGSGQIAFQPMNASETNTYYLTSSNNTFSGSYFCYNDSKSNQSTILKIKSEGSLGRDCASYKSRSVMLQTNAELYPEGSQTYNFTNRQFSILGSADRIRVDEGETFTLNSPLEFNANCTLIKVGGGTFAVGGKVTLTDSGSPSVTVAEGYVRADNARAFAGVSLIIADGAGIAAKYIPGAASESATNGLVVVDAAKFSVAGTSLPVRIVTAGAKIDRNVKVPFLTVPATMAATIDALTLSPTHDVDGRSPVLVMEDVTVDSTPSVRYSYKFLKHGLLIIVK